MILGKQPVLPYFGTVLSAGILRSTEAASKHDEAMAKTCRVKK